jgi:hypothetical protein
MSRPLSVIANEIHSECNGKAWYVYAEAYVTPMKSLTDLSDNYYFDSADSIVSYALANLSYWRGDKAKAIKAELNAMLKEHRKTSA